MNRIMRLNLISMKANNKTLLLLAFIYKAIFFVFFVPIFQRVLRYVLTLWGQSYITLGNISSFLLYPPTILLLLVTVFILLILTQLEITTMLQFCQMETIHKKPNLIRILFLGVYNTFRCMLKGKLSISLVSFLLYLTTNIPLLIVMILRVRIPGTIIKGTSDEMFLKALAIIILFFIAFISFQCLFVMPYCVVNRQSLRNAKKNSSDLIQGKHMKTATILVLYNILLLLCFFLIYYTVVFVAAIFTFLFADKSMVIAVFISIFPRINFYIGIFFSMISLTINLNFIVSLFQEYQVDQHGDELSKAILLEEQKLRLTSERHKAMFIVILFLLVILGSINLYQAIRTDSFYLKRALPGIRITSHRGYSGTAPENTLPALEKAMEAMADYAEIDVQQTKDGVLVLLHDKSLRRTTGLNKYLWAVTYDEVSNLDAGYWFHKDYENTKVPTLEEALALCKGRIMLNLDIKIHGNETNMAEELVALIESYEFQYQCVISSTNYKILSQIKQLNPEIKTGYIISAAYGNFYDKPEIDFFSINSNFVHKNVINNAHKAGKEVHAWTVNSANEMERMKSLGVDNIITDRVTLAKEVFYSNDNNRSFIQLLNKMMTKRPLI